MAARMGKVILELGGNNAIIVDEFANMKLAVPAISFGAVGTAGQRCTSTRRVLVHKSRFDELKAKLVAAYKQVRIGDPLEEGTLMGPLVNELSVKAYLDAVEAVKEAGGEILVGGKRKDGEGFFVEPIRDIRTYRLPDPLCRSGRGDCPAQRRAPGFVFGDFHRQRATCGAFPVCSWQ
jgi:aldehyde dehydrogenase (NAD+)